MRTLDELRDPFYLQRVLGRSIRVERAFPLTHSPAQLWPFVSNTDMINRRSGLPSVTYSFRKNPAGGTFAHGRYRVGPVSVEFEELPFEWVAPRYLRSDRVFQNGMLKLMRYEVSLAKRTDGGTDVVSAVAVAPAFIGTLGRPILTGLLGRIERVYREIDARLGAEPTILPAVGFLEDAETVQNRVQELAEAWKALLPESDIPHLVADFVVRAPDRFLRRIRPFEIAEQHSLDRLDTLKFFLLATRNGYFNLSWDILCPSCGGDKSKSPSLEGLPKNAHCESCDIDYDASFDQNVEVTFSPSAKVRDVGQGVFCFGNPANTAHILAQQSLGPGKDMRLALDLAEGRYRLRSPTVKGKIVFDVEATGRETSVSASLDGELGSPEEPRTGRSVALSITNPRDYTQTVRVEDLWWLRHATTAAFVTSLQDFRDLFSSEVLSPGVQLGISSLTVMFTDLKGSTSMYDAFGDAKAFSLVQSHFDILHRVIGDHSGGIVKTIGDAVMAAFQRPEDAFEAGLSILREFATWNVNHAQQDQIIIKLGFFEGPCIALTQNEKLDYFGSTVNRANRIQDQSRGGDIVLPERVFETAGIRHILEHEAKLGRQIAAERFEAALKGFTESQVLYRVRLVDEQPSERPGA